MAAKTSEWRPGPTVCRCCLTEGCYKDVSTEYFWMGKREVYAEMLKETLEISIAYSKAGGPNSNSRLICEACISRLRDATEFKRQVVECERMFMQHLDPGSSSQETDTVESEPMEKIKIEGVKLEKSHSDDDFDIGDRHDFGGDDDDDDDLDDQPLTKLASKIPKKESVDLLDLLDNSKAAEKRKTTSKAKAPPSKKAKTKVEPVKSKPSSSKPKPEKKKKGDPLNQIILNRLLTNAIIVRKMTPTNAKLTENLNSILYKPKDTRTRFSLSFKEVTTQKAPSSSLTIKNTLLESPKIKSEKMPSGSISFIKQTPTFKERILMRRLTLLKSITLCPFKYHQGIFRCLYCDAQFMDVHQVEEHNKLHEPLGKDVMCKRSFKKSLNARIKLNVKEFGCKICGDIMENWDVLKEHLTEKHGLEIDTENDNVILYKINKNNFDCALCDKKFVTYIILNLHVKEHYMDYFCDQCGTGFLTATALKYHLKSHELGSYPCTVCSKEFKSKAVRDMHYKSVHIRVRKNVCNICRETFENYYGKLRHMKDFHNADVPDYKCSYCPKVFLINGALRNHEKIAHLRTVYYTCDLCDYKHHNKACLKRHMIVHSSEKSHNCNICGKAYARRCTLREHMRIHNNDRRFTCEYCDRAFVQKCSLKGHMKTHHKDVDVVFD